MSLNHLNGQQSLWLNPTVGNLTCQDLDVKGEFKFSAGDLTVSSLASTSTVLADGNVETKQKVIAGGDIETTGRVFAGGDVDAGVNMFATGNVTAGVDMFAGGKVVAAGNVEALEVIAPTICTNLLFSDLTLGGNTNLRGTQIKDDAEIGRVGQYEQVSVGNTALVDITYIDLTSFSLTKGDWMIGFNFTYTGDENVAEIIVGVSDTPLNNGANLVANESVFTIHPKTPVAISIIPVSMTMRKSFAADTTWYLKVRVVYSGAQPQGSALMWARRMR